MRAPSQSPRADLLLDLDVVDDDELPPLTVAGIRGPRRGVDEPDQLFPGDRLFLQVSHRDTGFHGFYGVQAISSV